MAAVSSSLPMNASSPALLLASHVDRVVDEAEVLLKRPFAHMHLAIIPTASNDPMENPASILGQQEFFRRKFAEAKILHLEAFSAASLAREFEDVHAVLIQGGGTFYLMYHILKTGFADVIKDLLKKKGLVMGSSAGANILCPTIVQAREYDAYNRQDYPLPNLDGLSLVNFNLILHADKKAEKDPEKLERTKADLRRVSTPMRKTYCLQDNEGILVRENKLIFMEGKAVALNQEMRQLSHKE